MSIKEQNKNRLVDLGTAYSLAIYCITAVVKIVFGTIGHSQALFTDGLNSISDVISTLILYIGLKLSRRPKDENHAYGHYRFESVSTLISSLVMFLIGGQALIGSVREMFVKQTSEPTQVALIAAIISIILIISSAIINYFIAKKTNVSAARAVAKNNISDSFTAIGALVAIISAQFKMPIIDTIASVIISLIIIQTAWSIFKEAGMTLTDGFDQKELDVYRNALRAIPEVKEIRDIKGRMLGNFPTLDIEIAVDGTLSVADSHIIADNIEHMFKDNYGIHRTQVHIEPYGVGIKK